MLLQIIWNSNQSLFHIGSFELRYYSLLFMMAFLSAGLILRYFFKKENKPLVKLETLMTYIIVGTLVGARLGHVIFYDWAYFRHHLLEIFLPFRFSPHFEFSGFSGLASHGAVIGIFVAVILFKRKNKEFSLVWLLDRGCIATVIACSFVRIGNFMNSEIIGKITSCSFPFAIKFLRNKDVTRQKLFEVTGIRDYQKSLATITSESKYSDFLATIPCRHPAQLYEAFLYLVIFIMLWIIYHKTNKKNTPYFLFSLFLITIFTARFFVEFIKESQGGFESFLGLLSTGQWLSLPLIIIGFYLMFKNRKAQF